MPCTQALAFAFVMQAGLQRSIETWNLLIQGYGRKRDLDRAVVFLTELQAARLTPNADTYRCLIEAFSHSGRTEDGERMVRESGITLADVHYNVSSAGGIGAKRTTVSCPSE